MAKWSYAGAAHLLRRAGFGAPRKEVLKTLRRGRKKAVARLTGTKSSGPRFEKEGDHRMAAAWWLRRMLDGQDPLREKMVLFWHGHFATSVSKVEDVRMLSAQNGIFRRHAFGAFRDLVQAVARDPAMLLWLDNVHNRKDHPNENFARELMELFTLGVVDDAGRPNYTETDVREAARAFTGWSYESGRFLRYDGEHDFGEKTVLGLTGPLDGGDVIDHLVVRPQCARFLARKLWEFFAHPAPPAHVVDALAQVYLDNDTRIAPVLRALFLRPEFEGETARTGRVSPPVEFAVATLRTLRTEADERALPWRLSQMGQELYVPPNVAGWPGGLAWMNSVTRTHRMAFTWDALTQEGPDADFRTDALRLLDGLPRRATTAQTVAHVIETLALPAVSDATAAALAEYLDTAPDGSPEPFDRRAAETARTKLRGLVGLVLTLPEAYLA